ncbi:hypothetical protein [Streptomyces aidingensis]|uniref:LPXTG-motif cell wall anchor domain-containing protein n=1 Tax=Streptomyces aidingensis TaxID=910347 RepID=A0A1I1HHP5_9ACTN|nr:hypothetical protein [Streptomyces aidingensis]SFC23336.1 hypothetical protein SAMN05421773_102386 [Streptomyces aidingensis]
MRTTRKRARLALLTILATLLGSAAVVLGSTGTAHAALAGDFVPAETEGSTTASPMFSSATVSQPCPADYRSGLVVLVVIDGSEYSLSGVIRDGAPYDEPFTFSITTGDRSLKSRLDARSAGDGTYEIRVRCWPDTGVAVDAAQHFAFQVQVSGESWTLVREEPEETQVALSVEPAGHSVIAKEATLTATVTPAAAEGHVRFQFGAQVVAAAVPVTNGTATTTYTAPENPTTGEFRAVFTPSDPGAYGAATSDPVPYAVVDETSVTVRDEDENVLPEESVLEAGQSLLVSAEGFYRNEAVRITLADSEAAFPEATADGSGAVNLHRIGLPGDLADGDHTLRVTGATSGITIGYPFTIGEGNGTEGGQNEGSTEGETEGSTEGETEGGENEGSTEGETEGGEAQGSTEGDSGGGLGGAAGALGGVSGGDTGLSGGSASGGPTPHGGGGPLANTGADIMGFAFLGLLMAGAGVVLVVRARRLNRPLLSFGTARQG